MIITTKEGTTTTRYLSLRPFRALSRAEVSVVDTSCKPLPVTPEKKRISRKQLSILKKGLKMKHQEREVLVGLLLGDGSLNTQDKGGTYRLVYSQGGQRHQAYFNCVYTIFRDWVVGSPRTIRPNPAFLKRSSCKHPASLSTDSNLTENELTEERKAASISQNVAVQSPLSSRNPLEGGIEVVRTRQTRWVFATISHASFRFYGKAFYKNGKRVVPKGIGRLLTERGLAFWYMDDGSIKSKQSKGVLFNTQGFDLPEVKRLCDVLTSKFGLRATPRVQRSKAGVSSHQIYVSGHSYERLRELLLPHMIPEMLYKFPPARVGRGSRMQATHPCVP